MAARRDWEQDSTVESTNRTCDDGGSKGYRDPALGLRAPISWFTSADSTKRPGKNWDPMHVVLSMGGEGELPKRFNGVSDACLPVDSKWHRLFLFACWMHGLRDSNGNFRSDLSADSWDWAHQHLLPIYYCRRYPHADNGHGDDHLSFSQAPWV